MMNRISYPLHIQYQRSHLTFHIADQVVVVAELETRLEHDLNIH